MADKAGKRKAKAKREKASVLGNLPATRPQRLGRPRTDAPRAAVEEPPPAPPEPPRSKRETPRHAATGSALVEASPAGRARATDPAPAAKKPSAAKPAAAKKPAAKRSA